MKIIAKVQKNNTTIRLSIDKSIVDLYKLKEMGPEERLEIIIVRKINLNEFDKEWEEKSKNCYNYVLKNHNAQYNINKLKRIIVNLMRDK